MFAVLASLTRRNLLAAAAAGVAALGIGSYPAFPLAGAQQPAPAARAVLGPAAVVPLAEQPPPQIVVDRPLPEPLAKGLVVIQFRTENLRISPVFGDAALAVSPRIGHLHIYVDDAPWLWAHVSSDEVVIHDLPSGPHQVRFDLVNANHQPLAQEVVRFRVPQRPSAVARGNIGRDGKAPVAEQPSVKLVVEPPQPDLLALGVAYIRFRTENVKIAPVFGPAALAISPRIGHLQITVDDAPWHWTDASGQPVDVGNLPPGPHTIRIELVDANHQPLAQEVVRLDVPRR